MNWLVAVPIGLIAFIGLFWSSRAVDSVMQFHAFLLFLSALIAGFYIIRKGGEILRDQAIPERDGIPNYNMGVVKVAVIASMFWEIGRAHV